MSWHHRFLEVIEPNKENPFQDFVGIKLEKVDEVGSYLSLELEPHHFNLYGIVHGGVYSTILDIAMGIAGGYSGKKDEKISTITLNLNINYLSETKCEKIYATGLIARRSHKLVFCEGRITDKNKNVISTSTGVFKLIRN